jgi:SAM-dependent methyltransferase
VAVRIGVAIVILSGDTKRDWEPMINTMTHHEPTPDNLYQDPELAQFYDLANGWGADFDYCLQLAQDARSVLDLGCGTGQLAARLADRRDVAGVDPAAAMLDIARCRPGGDRITWVEADARRVRLGRRFDLALLTGHAFQVFLTDDDQRAVLSTIAEHLAPGGRFIFDTRNPATQEWRDWTPTHSRRRFEHPSLGTIEAWCDYTHDTATGIVTYETHYQTVASERHFSAASKIRFTTQESLAAMLDQVGLKVDEWLGDWTGGAYEPTSVDIIPVGRHP